MFERELGGGAVNGTAAGFSEAPPRKATPKAKAPRPVARSPRAVPPLHAHNRVLKEEKEAYVGHRALFLANHLKVGFGPLSRTAQHTHRPPPPLPLFAC